MNATWFLMIFLFTGNPQESNYLDKVVVPMTGSMEQMCRRDQNGIWRYIGKLEGTDRHKTLTVCITGKD